MADYTGTTGNDVFTGTTDGDNFFLDQGGDDVAKGGGGDDTFYLGGALTAADKINGQGNAGGGDLLDLDGDYSAGVIFRAKTVTNIETILLHAGHGYNLTLSDATAASGAPGLVIDGSGLGAGDEMRIDARRDTDATIQFRGGAGDDVLFGGGGPDYFDLSTGGNDRALGGGESDTFHMDAAFTAFDRIDGGGAYNYLNLDGDYSAGLKLRATTIVNIGEIDFAAGHDYKLTTDDANVAPGQLLNVWGFDLGSADSLTFNGSAETDGRFAFYSGPGTDRLTGGAGDDTFVASGGADIFTGGAGADEFNFRALSDSPAAAPDRITDLQDADVIDISVIDADTIAPGDQGFTLVSHFSHTAGEAMLKYSSGSDTTTLSLDVNGDGVADGKILLTGDHSGFTDFVL